MSKVKENLPTYPETDDMGFTKKLFNCISKLETVEDSFRKELKNSAKKLSQVNSELKHYLKIQNNSMRNYIQMINRKSKLIKNQDLKKLKQHVKNIEKRLKIQENVKDSLMELSNGYKEYKKTLKDYGKVVQKLNKSQNDWQKSASDLAKAKSSKAVSGEKLDKIEKSIKKDKENVIKKYNNRFHKESFVETAMVRVTNGWEILKNSIKKFEW